MIPTLNKPSDQVASLEDQVPLDWIDRFALVGCALVQGLMAWRFWFLTDDAYISFRYARNFARGFGLRYNLGDHTPVEGYSNFLWVLVCSIFEYFQMNIELWPLLLSAACGLVLLWRVFRALRVHLGLERWTATVSALAFAASPQVAVWSTGGLATMPFALVLFFTFELLILDTRNVLSASAIASGIVLALIRVEGVYWLVVLLLMAFVLRLRARTARVKPLLIYAAIVGGTYAAYFAWRFSYYGLPFANTVYAKGELELRLLDRGLDYVIVQMLTCLVPLLLLPATLFAIRGVKRHLVFPSVLMAWGIIAYAVCVTGDYMPMGRFLVPGWSFTVLALGVMIAQLCLRFARRSALILAAAVGVVGLGLLPAWNVHLVSKQTRQKFHFRHNTKVFLSEYEQWASQKQATLIWACTGRALHRWVPQNSTIVLGSIGAKGYYSDRFIYDKFGIVTRAVTERPVPEPRLKSPGHDKSAPMTFLLPFNPDIMDPIVVNALYQLEITKDLAFSREMFIRFVRRYKDKKYIKIPTLADEYVVDFRPMPDWELVGPNRYLVFMRRVRDGESIEEEKATVRQRMLAILRGIDPNRTTMLQGYPAPAGGIPRSSR